MQYMLSERLICFQMVLIIYGQSYMPSSVLQSAREFLYNPPEELSGPLRELFAIPSRGAPLDCNVS